MKVFLQGKGQGLAWTLPFLLVWGGAAGAQDSTLLQGANRPLVARPASASQPEPMVLPDPVRFGHAMELGDMFQARRWLEGGLDPEFEADRIGTGLMIGAWSGNIPLMELFLAHGGTVEHRNSLGETALLLAAWKGQIGAVSWLLDHGAAVNRPNGQWTALHYGAFAGHQEVVDLLLARGGDINARSPNGSSVLMMAVYDGHDYPLSTGLRQAGEAIHHMGLRVTVDRHFQILDAQGVTEAAPYGEHCRAIVPEYRRLVGLNLFQDFRRALRQRLGGVAGCSHLTELAMAYGVTGAVVLRVLLTTFAALVMHLPWLKMAGGCLLLWIGIKLLLPEDEGEGDITAADSLWGAVRTIIVADFVMSLDNVIGVAGAAHGSLLLLFLGLAVSIPLIVWSSQLILHFMERWPVVVTLGAALLGYVAGEMFWSDHGLARWLAPYLTGAPLWLPQAVGVLGAVLVVALGKGLARRRPTRPQPSGGA